MSEASFETIISLIRSDTTKIEDILTHTEFNKFIRTENPILLEFLSKKSTILEMSSFCFSLDKISSLDNEQITIGAINVFTSSVAKVFLIFLRSSVFAKVLHDFLKSDSSLNPRLCGYFLRILSQQIRWGNSEFFLINNDIGELLIKRMQNLAIQELIVLIASRHTLNVFSKINLPFELSRIALLNNEDSGAAISLLVQLYDNLSDESPILKQFFNDNVVSNIIEISCTNKSQLVSSDCMNVVRNMVELGFGVESIIGKWTDKLLITQNNINVLSVSAIHILNVNFIDIFKLFFEPNSCSLLHNACSQILINLNVNDIENILLIENFVDKLIMCHGTDKWCPHMMQVSIVFSKNPCQCKCLQTSEWRAFVKAYLIPVLTVLENQYGGPMPQENDDYFTTDSVTDSDDYYSEEEEIYIGQDDEMDHSSDDEP